MQIPLRTSSTIEDYVAAQEWRRAHLSSCPFHPDGGCSLQRHGSYARLTSPGVRIARWYCPQGRMTFSLLPDFLAVRFPGLLATIEHAVAVTASTRSMEVAADILRGPEVDLPGAMRWLRRRVVAVRRSMTAVTWVTPSLVPEVLECPAIGDDTPILPKLRRALPLSVLNCIPAPLGFARVPRGEAWSIRRVPGVVRDVGSRAASRDGCRQHEVGPDRIVAASYAGSDKMIGCPCRPNPRPPPRISTVFGAPTAA
ncbi:hypothetical protein [Mesorhizobium sp.]|uniref:hypothetical protein n=1 Tax=Mesorhizobium sp. TaxID=1871066 RepID=UPI0025795313|nr:hypothetical protein [Mesorhizobium sp.]